MRFQRRKTSSHQEDMEIQQGWQDSVVVLQDLLHACSSFHTIPLRVFPSIASSFDVYTYMCIYMCVCVYIYTHTNTHTFTYIYIHICIHTYIYTHILAYINTCTHTCISLAYVTKRRPRSIPKEVMASLQAFCAALHFCCIYSGLLCLSSYMWRMCSATGDEKVRRLTCVDDIDLDQSEQNRDGLQNAWPGSVTRAVGRADLSYERASGGVVALTNWMPISSAI